LTDYDLDGKGSKYRAERSIFSDSVLVFGFYGVLHQKITSKYEKRGQESGKISYYRQIRSSAEIRNENDEK
jgi:hypothetical protein